MFEKILTTQFFSTDQFDKNSRLSVHEVVEKNSKSKHFYFAYIRKKFFVEQ